MTPLPQVTGPGRASPVPAATIDTFRAPYAGESFTAAIQDLHRFHGLRPVSAGSALPRPASPKWTGDISRRRRLRFMLRTASSLPLFQGF
jgi:hypothetical protein